MAPKPSAWAWFLPLSLLVVALVAVPLRILEPEGLPRYRALRQELAEIEHRTGELRRELRALQRRARALRVDPSAVERIARDELGMIRQGEVLYEFDDTPPETP